MQQPADAVPLWLSSYQLLIHFQGSMNGYGFVYNKRTKTWEDSTNIIQQEGFFFLQSATWFMACVKNFARSTDQTFTVKSQMSWGTVFRSWQRCALIKASPSQFTTIDSLLHQQGAVTVKAVTTALRQCRPFLGKLT